MVLPAILLFPFLLDGWCGRTFPSVNLVRLLRQRENNDVGGPRGLTVQTLTFVLLDPLCV